MKLAAKAKLDAVFKYPIFQSVGRTLPVSVTPIENWEKAAKVCSSNKWERCCLLARNALQQKVEERNWARAQDWGPLADELRPSILSFVEALLSNSTVPNKLKKKIGDQLSWDIMLICFESAYSDLVDPIFYIPELEPWYSSGHFPCGWDGEDFPDRWDGVEKNFGKLIVF